MDYLASIRRGLQADQLPGQAAQLTMAHAHRGQLPGPDHDHRRAAVMALFYPDSQGALNLVFIQRTSHDPRDRHAGQIAFPGGSVDPEDESLAATALRETEEEIGVPRNQIELLGELTDLYIPVSNFLVTPFIGYLPQRPDYILQTSEVAKIIEVPFSAFLQDDARQSTTLRLSNGMTIKDVPHWAVADEIIWGATAMITAEIVALGTE